MLRALNKEKDDEKIEHKSITETMKTSQENNKDDEIKENKEIAVDNDLLSEFGSEEDEIEPSKKTETKSNDKDKKDTDKDKKNTDKDKKEGKKGGCTII